jgi:hypothetical protein
MATLKPSTASSTTTLHHASIPSTTTTHIRLAIQEPSGPPLLNESSVKAFFQGYAHHVQAVLDGVISTEDLPDLFLASSSSTSSSTSNPSPPAPSSSSSKPSPHPTTSDNPTPPSPTPPNQRPSGGLKEGLKRFKTQGMRRCHLDEVSVTVLDRHHAEADVRWSLFRERAGRGTGDVVFAKRYMVRQREGEEMRICGTGE